MALIALEPELLPGWSFCCYYGNFGGKLNQVWDFKHRRIQTSLGQQEEYVVCEGIFDVQN